MELLKGIARHSERTFELASLQGLSMNHHRNPMLTSSFYLAATRRYFSNCLKNDQKKSIIIHGLLGLRMHL